MTPKAKKQWKKNPYEEKSLKNSDGLLINGGSSYEPSRQSSALVSEASRVQRIQDLFVELKTLGRGQFGKVLKCLNKTD